MLVSMSAEKTKDQDRRRYGMVPVGIPAGQVTRPIFGKHGFAGGAMIVDWPAIVGAATASYTLPLRIRFARNERTGGTLEVKVSNSAFATELQHLEPLILERINGYFGWGAVARLKLRHGPLPANAPGKPVPPVLPPPAQDRLTALTAQVENPQLREALERLGRYIAAKP
jgi:hypothetical protein